MAIDKTAVYEHAKAYVLPPMLASIAMLPSYPFFVRKTFLQIGLTPPTFLHSGIIQNAVKAGVTTGVIVGTQLAAQSVFARALSRAGETPSFNDQLLSSFFVGIVSSPPMAVFNGYTLGKNARTTLAELKFPSIVAISLRESSFVASFPLSVMLTSAIEERFGKECGASYLVPFSTAAVTSILSHPFDTALTLWQQGASVQNALQLGKGSVSRALALGTFVSAFTQLKRHAE